MEEELEGKRLWQQIIETITVYNPNKRKVTKFDETSKTVVTKSNRVTVSKPKKRRVIKPEVNIKSYNPEGVHASLSHNQLDRSTKRKLIKGKIRPEATIDLHDMTQAQAYKALTAFMLQSFSVSRRTVLVITGKGKNLTGVLRNKLPMWLEQEDLAKNIVSIMPAARKDGGEGAFYIRLKNLNKYNR